MGKRWIMLLVIALVGILATMSYAEPKMVIVLDPATPGSFVCYNIDNFNPTQGTSNFAPCSDDSISNPIISGEQQVIKIRDKNNAMKYKEFSDHPLRAIGSATILFSNPCVTYWYHGHSYTVCN